MMTPGQSCGEDGSDVVVGRVERCEGLWVCWIIG